MISDCRFGERVFECVDEFEFFLNGTLNFSIICEYGECTLDIPGLAVHVSIELNSWDFYDFLRELLDIVWALDFEFFFIEFLAEDEIYIAVFLFVGNGDIVFSMGNVSECFGLVGRYISEEW